MPSMLTSSTSNSSAASGSPGCCAAACSAVAGSAIGRARSAAIKSANASPAKPAGTGRRIAPDDRPRHPWGRWSNGMIAMAANEGTAGAAVPGRRRVTSRAELEHVAFELFAAKGFEQTTVDDIAAAAGIGRRTFFRYFPSKNDVPWGMFELELERMRVRL